MAKQRIKVRINWKSILYIALALLLCAGIGFGIYKIVDKTTTTEIRASAFSIGGLNANGKYKETKESIYTKDAFECQGLTITPKFESMVSYEVFFYNEDGEFLSNTGRMTTKYNTVPAFAKYARIVITPLEDEEISLLETNKYAKQLTIVVNKVQKFVSVADVNYFEIDENYIGAWYGGTAGAVTHTPTTTVGESKPIVIPAGVTKLKVSVPVVDGNSKLYIHFLDEKQANIVVVKSCDIDTTLSATYDVVTIDIPSNAYAVAICYNLNANKVAPYIVNFVK